VLQKLSDARFMKSNKVYHYPSDEVLRVLIREYQQTPSSKASGYLLQILEPCLERIFYRFKRWIKNQPLHNEESLLQEIKTICLSKIKQYDLIKYPADIGPTIFTQITDTLRSQLFEEIRKQERHIVYEIAEFEESDKKKGLGTPTKFSTFDSQVPKNFIENILDGLMERKIITHTDKKLLLPLIEKHTTIRDLSRKRKENYSKLQRRIYRLIGRIKPSLKMLKITDEPPSISEIF